MEKKIKELPAMAGRKRKENILFFRKLRQNPPRELDSLMQELHSAEFSRTDCRDCANCCKTTGPLFTASDVSRIAKHLRQKPSQFAARYLKVDEVGDEVLRSLPCPFLREDNACSIYEVRPKACREFPHTDRKKFHQLNALTLRNLPICPAAFEIVEAMKRRLKTGTPHSDI